MRKFRTLAAVAALAAIALLVPATAQAVAPGQDRHHRGRPARLRLERLNLTTMTTEASPTPGGAPRRVAYATNLYVGVVAVAGICLTAAAIRLDGIVLDATFVGAAAARRARLVAGLRRCRRRSASASRSPASSCWPPWPWSAQPAPGSSARSWGPSTSGRAPLRARVFNSGMFATMGVVGGAAYIAVGGEPGGPWPVGTWQIVLHVGIPVLVADVVQFAVNLVLIAVVVRLAAGLSMRTQVVRILRSAGSAHLGYGIIAFIMVVLWGPSELGSASVFLVLPPLLVAQWAYGQYAEEIKGHERALHVLVAAVEAKAPHLAGHSTRVAELSASMAEHLGLRAQAGRRHPDRRHAPRPRPDHVVDRSGPEHRRGGWRRTGWLPGARGPPAPGPQLPVGRARRDRASSRRSGAQEDRGGDQPAGPRRRAR